MRLDKIVLIFLVIGLFGCTKKNKEITINGRINGFIDEKVEFTTPIEGKWFYGDKKSIAPDSTGSFQIKMKIDEPSFVTMYVPGKSGGVLLVEPDRTYEVIFNIGENKNENKFVVNSENSFAQNLYNSFPTPEFYISGVRDFFTDSIPSEISKKINGQKEKAISEFDELLEKEKISKDFHQLAVLDRKSYYLALEISVVTMLTYKYINESDNAGLTQFVDFWDKKLDKSMLNESNFIRSPWFYVLTNKFLRFKQLSSEGFDPKQDERAYDNGDLYKNNVDEAKKVLSGNELEYYLATYIYDESWQTKNNAKEIILIYNNFKNEYPNSLFNEYLASSVKPIIDFHKKLEETQVNEEVQFVKNYTNIDTFDELIKNLKGKKVLVDIWGTWCGPCKKEFQDKSKSIELLKNKNITTLYICEGKFSKEKVWMEMIKFYDLEGQHLLANEKLIADIIDKFGNNGSFAYPRYMLVDENGNVVNAEASYPSQIEQLEKEINENYVWQ